MTQIAEVLVQIKQEKEGGKKVFLFPQKFNFEFEPDCCSGCLHCSPVTILVGITEKP